ncbi:bifunctional serine/threonine-protein kinase/transporter substrate-binding domain-containing protein [Streptomyces sp. LX-29]|uniref:bifunctional serine/threonine-protein kinase/transporter substrate-binding domain-containing protein n=1 Tax=Streptomyces sp. LX-29 TaxID=2900152 RepID=UPI00240E3D9B|nr:bifunctional serine/threonine-protein kinase/transporter substrate-binding domain-containing protein [Streptomyces sp. LX-29]WFB05854.1 bifunctional serine/threonine-protein kinase/transporter substrate-binding domain-containing protein [Streptomyces sp. LX-29]
MGVLVRPLAKGDPQQIGPFRIIGLLGGGGMGRVFLGRAADGRTVAVKTARSELADDRGFRARFAREVAAAQRVGGPFVAPVVDAAPDDDVPWMATTFVPGVALSDAVHDHGPLSERTVRLLTAGLLDALAGVHAHGLVHRDLKPSNILLTAEGPRVIDFGIAHSAADTALTMTGTALGTPGFMAPEQLVMTGPRVTGAADVFALGGVIVFAATGSGPYGNAESQVLMYRTVHEKPRLDDVPTDGLRELAADCLAKEPQQRPALPDLVARVGAPGPYGDWLPEPVAAQLRRLSERLGDPRTPDPSVSPPPAEGPAGAPFGPPPSGAAGTGGTPSSPAYGATPPLPPGPPTPSAPTAPSAPTTPSAPAASPPGRFGPAPATPPLGLHDITPVRQPYVSGEPTPPGPSRRRLLAGLSAVGVVAGGGALAWVMRSEGGDEGGAGRRTGADPGGSGKPSGGSAPGKAPSAVVTPSIQLPQEIRHKGIITVGSDTAYAPMEFVRDGEVVGVDVDLANALGGVLGVRFVFQDAVYDTLLAGLQTGRFDLVMSAMTDNRARQEGLEEGKKTGSGVDMIDYFSSGSTLVVRKGNPQGIEKLDDLSGRTVAVQRGTFGHALLDGLNNKVRKKLRIREFDASAEIYNDVANGRSAACVHDFPVAAHTAATHSGGDALELTGEQIDAAFYGIAVVKTGTVLRDAVRKALDSLIASGEYARILKKWHVEDGSVERAVINGGR